MIRGLFIAAGLLCVGLGVLGIFLPLLPTTPFLLLAAACFARSSPALHRWLLARPRLGALIRDWQAHGVIATAVKVRVTLLVALTFGLALAFARTPVWAKAAALAVILGALAFIWTRPGAPRATEEA
jgi:hypothetical protein